MPTHDIQLKLYKPRFIIHYMENILNRNLYKCITFLMLITLIACDFNTLKQNTPKDQSEIKVPTPIFITETDITSSRYIDNGSIHSDVFLYCISAPLFVGFDYITHDFTKGDLITKSEILGTPVTKRMTIGKNGNIIFEMSDDNKENISFSMEYNPETNTFSYNQALFMLDAKSYHCITAFKGEDINLLEDGGYYGKSTIQVLTEKELSPSKDIASQLVVSDDLFIKSNNTYAIALLKGSAVQYETNYSYYDDSGIFIQSGKNLTYNNIISRFDRAKAGATKTINYDDGYQLNDYDKAHQSFGYYYEPSLVSARLDELGMPDYKK